MSSQFHDTHGPKSRPPALPELAEALESDGEKTAAAPKGGEVGPMHDQSVAGEEDPGAAMDLPVLPAPQVTPGAQRTGR